MSCCKSKLICYAAAMLLCIASCDRPAAPTSTTAPGPATPATAPTTAEFNMDGRPLSFDVPTAGIDRASSPPRVLIYSARENATGSFYFEVPVETETVGVGEQITWEQQLQQGELQDSLIGIELAAGQVLQPQSLRIELRLLSEKLAEVSLAGEFFVYQSGKHLRNASVQARFTAGVEEVR